MSPDGLALCAAGILLLAGGHRRAGPSGRKRRPRVLGGARDAWAQRPRRGARLQLGSWALPGWVPTPMRLAVAAPGSLLVVGPTRSGKTRGLCAPLVCSWDGPVLAASVKRDLAALVTAARRELGEVHLVAPGQGGTSTFDPVMLAVDYPAARALARDLTVGTGAGGAAEEAFWGALAAKLLAPMLLAARREGGGLATLVRMVDARDLDSALDRLDDEPEAAAALEASFGRDDRTLGSVLATIEAALDGLVPGVGVDPAALLSGRDTCLLAAPLHDQRRHRAMFSGLIRQVLACAATRAEAGDPARLLVLLDEAASIAPLDELDSVAATCQGQGVTLVTVWQDLAQLVARYGTRARTVVNNHTSRVLLGGLADPTLLEWLPTLTGTGPVTGSEPAALGADELRRFPHGCGVLVADRHRAVRIVLGAAARGR